MEYGMDRIIRDAIRREETRQHYRIEKEYKAKQSKQAEDAARYILGESSQKPEYDKRSRLERNGFSVGQQRGRKNED